MMKSTGIFFDLDNTLFDYEEAFKQASIKSFSQLWIEGEITGNRQSNPVTVWFQEFKKSCDHYWGQYESGELSRGCYQEKRLLTSLERCSLKAQSENIYHTFEQKLRSHIPSFCSLKEGMCELLNHLAKYHITLGIITNGTEKLQREKINILKLDHWFSHKNIFISEALSLQKPDPTIFKEVQRQTRCQYPVYVGDSWDQDVIPAYVSGWRAIWVSDEEAPSSVRNGIHTASSIDELHHVIISYIE